MALTVEISAIQYIELVKRAEQAIRSDFDSFNGVLNHESLINEAIRIGCTPEFIQDLKKDL